MSDDEIAERDALIHVLQEELVQLHTHASKYPPKSVPFVVKLQHNDYTNENKTRQRLSQIGVIGWANIRGGYYADTTIYIGDSCKIQVGMCCVELTTPVRTEKITTAKVKRILDEREGIITYKYREEPEVIKRVKMENGSISELQPID
jgi:hypothetical protein